MKQKGRNVAASVRPHRRSLERSSGIRGLRRSFVTGFDFVSMTEDGSPEWAT